MSKVKTVSYKCSTGRDGFFSESLEISLDTSDNDSFLSADALGNMNTLADELRAATQAKMDEWAKGVRTSAAPEPTTFVKRGTITDKQLEKLKGFSRQWSQIVIAQFLEDEHVHDVIELDAAPAQMLVDELFARAKEYAARKNGNPQTKALT